MALQHRVLCFGHDLMLLETRRWVLEKRFVSVYVSSLGDLARVAGGGGFDLLILCHSLSQQDVCKAADLAHDVCPGLKLLALGSATTEWELPVSDQLMVGLAGPQVLLEKAEQMLQFH